MYVSIAYIILIVYVKIQIFIMHVIIRSSIHAQPNSATLTKHGRVQYFIYCQVESRRTICFGVGRALNG